MGPENPTTSSLTENPLRDKLDEQLRLVSENCTGCGLCVRECGFLQSYDDPKQLAESYDPTRKQDLSYPFECSLCELCSAVCPHEVKPSRMFLEMRREAFERGEGNLSEHNVLRRYEKTGMSRRYSWYALPEDCDTVFFPGCALTGSRPDTTLNVYRHVQKQAPAVGIVLDCCGKPSHDLGDEAYFLSMFEEMTDYLVSRGVQNILVACPNCYRVFNDHAPRLKTRTVYELLNEYDLPETAQLSATVTVHDPCVSRFNTTGQTAVRELLGKKGLSIAETEHSGARTLCCGEGGAVGCLAPERAQIWKDKRLKEAGEQHITSYCASCTQTFAKHTSSSHVLDLLLTPEQALSGRASGARAPFTYLNRLRVKNHLKRTVSARVTRERTFQAGPENKGPLLKKLAILTLLTLAFFAVRSSGMAEYLDQNRLRELIAGYGLLAPLVYMLIYAIAPALFLPGLPIGIAGGILFGPFWGVVYTITSATVGACLAFLISRYLARDLIESRLKGPRWQRLNQQVEQNGWKVVALTRLIPLFPFNLLNYAFGLTRVRFTDYALATFVFMLPGCIAFITFSSSLLDLLRGEISGTFLFGLLLIVSVSLLPVIYRKVKKNRGQAA